QYKIAKVMKLFHPSAPICTRATTQSVKWAIALTCFTDNIGASNVAIPYQVTATTMHFKIGSVLTLSHAPRKVNRPLIIPPQLGAINIMENTTPNDCTQLGKEVYNKW